MKAGRQTDGPPGPDDGALVRLMREAIGRCRLDLGGLEILTEAASGPYRVTPVLAALAGARAVHAVTGPSRHGTIGEVVAQTEALARLAGVWDRIEILSEKRGDIVARADIVTNSGHVRPIDAVMIDRMKPSAVIPLMYEAWEFRAADLDLDACRRRGIPVAGTNEAHPVVGVASLWGALAVHLLADAGISPRGSRVLVLCDNPFESSIREALVAAGARVESCGGLGGASDGAGEDAIVVALLPRGGFCLGAEGAGMIAARWPKTVVAQFWGDIDRGALQRNGISLWPSEAPAMGHMGILPSALGPEPIVRLQAGGLKVGEILARQAAGVAGDPGRRGGGGAGAHDARGLLQPLDSPSPSDHRGNPV